MSFFAVTGLINALTSTILGFFVIRNKPRTSIIIKYAAFNFMVAVWSFGYFFWQLSTTPEHAIFWARILILGAMLIPPIFLDFVTSWIDQHHRHKVYLRVSYFLSLIFALANFTPLVVASVEPRNIFPFWPVPGVVFHFVLTFFLINAGYACYLLLKEMGRSSELRSKQLRLVLIGMIIGYVGGSTNFFLWYNIQIPPVGNGLAPIYMGMMTYAILRYRAMDINVIVRRTLIFTGLFSFFFGMFAILSFLVTDVLGQHLDRQGRLWIIAVGAGITAAMAGRLRSFLVDITDKYLFQKKFDYQNILRDASRGISKIHSLHRLLGLVIHFMTRRARIKSAAAYLRSRREDNFVLHYSRGYGDKRPVSVIQPESPIIEFFSKAKEALDRDRVELMLHEAAHKVPVSRDLIRRTVAEMKALGVYVCVPTFLSNELRYVLMLGEKKSGDRYYEPDLNLFYTLAQESAIAVENARLYDEAVKKNRELQQINNQLNDASFKLQASLSETEQANQKLRNTQAQLIHEQKMATLGRLASSVGHEVNNPLTILQMNVNRIVLKLRKDPDLMVKDVQEFFPKMESNINRIKAVVNTLTGLLKKHERGKMEPLSLKIVLEETLPLVQFQTYLDNLTGTEIAFHLPSDLPLIKGDLERLQEVFLNIFINAFQSMSQAQDRSIEVTGFLDPADSRMVCIRFKDNGCGMSEETLKRIFNFRFTTKEEGRGSGLGLYMCKYIVELHGGSILAESELGKGSEFTISLPVHEEHADHLRLAQ